MIMYFAGGHGEDFLIGKPILESFWYKREAVAAMEYSPTFFLDSGAFTAFTKNVVIKPDDYADFIHKHKHKITVASSLDSIGNAAETYELFLEMKRLGCDVIPVFHCREDYSYLKRYLDEGHDYLALGGMVPETKPWLAVWLEDLWANYLTNPDGTARIKVHGFGMTILDFIKKYPWHSVDSSSWSYGARFGAVLVQWPNGDFTWMYLMPRHGSAKIWGARHYDNLPPVYRTAVDDYFARVGSPSVEELKLDTRAINIHNIRAFDSWIENPDNLCDRFIRPPAEGGLFDGF